MEMLVDQSAQWKRGKLMVHRSQDNLSIFTGFNLNLDP